MRRGSTERQRQAVTWHRLHAHAALVVRRPWAGFVSSLRLRSARHVRWQRRHNLGRAMRRGGFDPARAKMLAGGPPALARADALPAWRPAASQSSLALSASSRTRARCLSLCSSRRIRCSNADSDGGAARPAGATDTAAEELISAAAFERRLSERRASRHRASAASFSPEGTLRKKSSIRDVTSRKCGNRRTIRPESRSHLDMFRSV